MSRRKSVTFEECYANIQTYIRKPENLALIRKAWEFAHAHHQGQFRKSGEPYEIHVIQVAYILSQLHSSPTTIVAGLLHDTVEDCDGVTTELVAQEFGQDVATIVEAVTKIGAIKFKDEKEYLASNHRKLFIAMAKDIRVILVKLADRLHNMRTLQYMKPEKQKKISNETLSVYAPIAHRLGISQVKNELEDLSFKYLEPAKYEEIKNLVRQREEDRNGQVHEMIDDIQRMLDEYHIPYRIFGRSKHFYSIYKKMITKNKRFEEILDLLAIRIVTDTELHCYEILGYIHAKYRPIPGRFKDYIAMPKANMYQSLHTTVVEPSCGNIFEIQIRTEQMDAVAERGIAAHYRYKESPDATALGQKELEDKLTWFRDFSMMTDEESEDPLEYMNVLQKDIFEANVYCMTPRGKIIALPQGSCPIDFAYRVHTEVGHKTVGATVNGAIVPLNTQLKTGDVVSILTNKNSAGPSADWIKIVKSGHARNKIRAFLQKRDQQDKKERIHQGQQMLEDELRRLKADTRDLDIRKVESILSSLSLKTTDDLFAGLADRKISLQAVTDRLIRNKPGAVDDEEIIKIYNRAAQRSRKSSECGVVVPGIDTIQVSLANCCNPIPGDPIIGYISKGQGVKVHRTDCPNIVNEKKRIIPVNWDQEPEDKQYEVKLLIRSDDRNYLLSDIVTTLQQNNAALKHVDSAVDDNNLTATTKLTVGVHDARHLTTLMANLKKVRSVNEVVRTIQ
ncbi:bifunctional (p)ppGpp synthetase/guanosine-3',5'-bis(diphosphate) 3'-pyrophosphohydrolase [uncultured Faecalibaculum sp.]|uniref:RelA/SpoT family protein n=1 Tax=uncultured Faecalibaculum sp. TaxID=1729681 RepID=UPI0025F7E7DA|nr:bifunctional (p)ppGpp synthetase/guanosine-3',5'-bis(diphosphate) 3'-pyrophosphohydrolase [uncultured Faecalibaculum sp.]